MARASRIGALAPTLPGGISLPGLGVAMPDFLFAALFLAAWVMPASLPAKTISYLMLVMLLGFIIVHSSAFMGSIVTGNAKRKGKLAGLVGFGGFYTLFVGAFAFFFKSWWPLATFWLQTVNRMLGVIFGQAPNGKEKEWMQHSWAASVLFYVGFTALTVLLPLPALGVTDSVVRAEGLPGTGLWIEEPHRVLAFGFFYFLAQGLWELHLDRKLGRAQAPGAAAARASLRDAA